MPIPNFKLQYLLNFKLILMWLNQTLQIFQMKMTSNGRWSQKLKDCQFPTPSCNISAPTGEILNSNVADLKWKESSTSRVWLCSAQLVQMVNQTNCKIAETFLFSTGHFRKNEKSRILQYWFVCLSDVCLLLK